MYVIQFAYIQNSILASILLKFTKCFIQYSAETFLTILDNIVTYAYSNSENRFPICSTFPHF